MEEHLLVMTPNDSNLHIPGLSTYQRSDRCPAGRYFNFLRPQEALVHNAEQYIAYGDIRQLHAIEIKGTFHSDWHIDLLSPFDCFWLIFQFIGQSSRGAEPNTTLSTGEYCGFYSSKHPQDIRMRAGKTWLILLGAKIDLHRSFSAEWPLLAPPQTVAPLPFSSVNIGYRVKQILDKIEQFTHNPYSLHSKLHHHLCLLLDVYHQDLSDKARSQNKEDVVIYHEAIRYIHENYMDEDINRDIIAAEIGISPRKLYRAFEGRNTTIKGAIQTIRLYKGREMLRETDMLVDGIAFQLNFSSAKYFYKQYVQQFGHSPTKERELHRKKKKR